MHCRIKSTAGLYAELPHKEFAADCGLARRTNTVTRSGQAPHQKHLVVFVQGILSNQK
jgi:hypothetical protein